MLRIEAINLACAVAFGNTSAAKFAYLYISGTEVLIANFIFFSLISMNSLKGKESLLKGKEIKR